MTQGPVTILPVPGVPMVEPGDDLPSLITDALAAADLALQDGDVIVVAQKIISKAEGCYVNLNEIEPSAEAIEIGARVNKDPEFVEAVLRESVDVVRTAPEVLIVEHHSGIVMANAGIDRSNIERGADDGMALLLPKDANASATRLRDDLVQQSGVTIAVVIADSVGRAWRYGTTALAIGCAGIEPLHDQRGGVDMFDHVLEVTEVALVDQIAAAANMVMGEATEAVPVAVVRGYDYPASERPTSVLIRAKNEDLFR